MEPTERMEPEGSVEDSHFELMKRTVQVLRKNPTFASYLEAGILRFEHGFSHWGLAELILDVDFISPDDVMRHYPGLIYTKEQIELLAQTLPTNNVLKWCKANDFVVHPSPPLPMSTIDIRCICPNQFHFKVGGWYENQRFALEDKTTFGWILIKKVPVEKSSKLKWDQQITLLSNFERVPNASEMCWFITTYFLINQIHLFESVYVRTSSMDEDGQRVYVGHYALGGVSIFRHLDKDRYNNLGLSACRQL
jgi:hypothetical protein